MTDPEVIFIMAAEKQNILCFSTILTYPFLQLSNSLPCFLYQIPTMTEADWTCHSGLEQEVDSTQVPQAWIEVFFSVIYLQTQMVNRW